jgi:hypothetical protein
LQILLEGFKNRRFSYLEQFYSVNLWQPLLEVLFPVEYYLLSEYKMTQIEKNYPPYRADFAVKVKKFAPPTLFVELARDHLVDISMNHKDEDKIAYMMGSSLYKLLWLNRGRSQEFLKKLRVFGILGGGTDFDLCQMYTVFPSADNNEDFYFVFDTSKTHLRFQILELNSFSDTEIYTESDDFDNLSSSHLKYSSSQSTAAVEGELSADLNEALISQILQEFDPDVSEEVLPLSVNIEERYCQRIFNEGHVNDHALCVLEKVMDLVKKQADLLIDMENDFGPTDPHYKYEYSRVNLMLKSRTCHSGPSPYKKKSKQSESAFNINKTPTRLIARNILSFLNIITVTPKEKCEGEDKENNDSYGLNYELKSKDFDVVSSDLKTICIQKTVSKYEIEIYQNEIIKKSDCFPKYFGHVELSENEMNLTLENIITGYETNDYCKQKPGQSEFLFSTKILVDLFGALMVLHSAGYVHGDVSPGNVGYNESKGIWQLFDFNNSRPIKEAAEGIGKFHVTKRFVSAQFLNSGLYFPFDDVVGLIKTFYSVNWYVPFDLTPELMEILSLFRFDQIEVIEVSRLQKIYFKIVKNLWKQVQDRSDPSIINAAKILRNLI